MKAIIFDNYEQYVCFIFLENNCVVITEKQMKFKEICDRIDLYGIGQRNVIFMKLINGIWKRRFL